MRRVIAVVFSMAVLLGMLAAPAAARPTTLTPLPNGEGIWLAGADAGTGVDGSAGTVNVGKNGATVTVKASGLVPGQAVTMWVAYFNDDNACMFPDEGLSRCGIFDVLIGNGGIVFGAGHVIDASGEATFTARLNVGDAAQILPSSPSYDPTATPYFLAIIRSHGPKIPTDVQLHAGFNGGCTSQVGPAPGQIGGEIPDAVGECGDMQLYVFETTPP